MDADLIPGPKGLVPCFLEGPKDREGPSPIFGNVPENMSFLFSKIWRPVMTWISKLKPYPCLYLQGPSLSIPNLLLRTLMIIIEHVLLQCVYWKFSYSSRSFESATNFIFFPQWFRAYVLMNTCIMYYGDVMYLVGCITCHYHWLNEVDTRIKELRRII